MRIVMTGGTSGIGLHAARVLLARGHDLTIGARSALPSGLSGATHAPLDLADLDSVRSFARAQGDRWIDVLLLNAGLQVVEPATSRQGYELGFAVNHLAHLLLLCELAGAMAQHGRIIVTASGTHDPAEKTGIPPPHHANARWLAFPSKDPHLDDNAGTAGRRAYAASKLCNIMAVRELHRRFGCERPDLMTAAFDPGFCPGTGLARDYPRWAQWLFRNVLPLVVHGENVSSPRRSGQLLAELATHSEWAHLRGGYVSVRRKQLRDHRPSALARDDDACAKLWDDSIELAGIADHLPSSKSC